MEFRPSGSAADFQIAWRVVFMDYHEDIFAVRFLRIIMYVFSPNRLKSTDYISFAVLY